MESYTTCWLTKLAKKVNDTQNHAVRDRLAQGRVEEARQINARINPVFRTCRLLEKQ